jgi:uncharacterized protein YqjF (DUF2071 family)
MRAKPPNSSSLLKQWRQAGSLSYVGASAASPTGTALPGADDADWSRLVAGRGDPFLTAKWERIVFFHFVVNAERIRPLLRAPFELDLHEGRACVSLAAVTMRRFRPCRPLSIAWCFGAIRRQQFLNLRTYVHCGGEPGVLFLHGWLSRPFGVALPSGLWGLSYAFASVDYHHDAAGSALRGVVTAGKSGHRFAYHSKPPAETCFGPCPRGSLSEFAMERCTGFFWRGQEPRVFRVWHPHWLQAPLEPTIEDVSLVTSRFPWFSEARMAEANYGPGFDRVWLGRAHPLDKACKARREGHRRLSSFFEMP